MWPGIIASVVGGLIQHRSNQDAQHSADAAAAKRDQLIQRQIQLFDKMYGNVQTADRAGQFDPGAQITRMAGDFSNQRRLATGNAGAALATLGYKPGDSESLRQVGEVSNSGLADFSKSLNDVRQGAFAAKQNAYSQVNPNGLSTGIQSYDNTYQRGVGSQQSLGPLLTNLVQYLPKKGEKWSWQ